MKTIIQTILLGLFAALCLQGLHSQNKVSYGYDAAGNRISRTIVIAAPLKSAPAPAVEEQPTVYSETLSGVELKIYPNPTDGLLKVEIHNLPEDQTADIRLYDMSGKLISSHKRVSELVTIDLSAQPQGTYLMKIVAGEYQTEWKIIKK